MNRTLIASLLVAAPLVAFAPRAPAVGPIDCKLTYNLSGWSAFYKTASGTGTIRCDNGQSASVRIRTKGGGLTVGKTRITNGTGEFSGVRSISEIFGTYVAAEATAGAARAADARVVTKGEVSLALAGKGDGWSLGVAFGKFVIER